MSAAEQWFAMTPEQRLEAFQKAAANLPPHDEDGREELAEQAAIDFVTAKVERECETAGILAELHESRHALDYIASRIDLPYYHAKAFRELLRRVRWLEREVEAALAPERAP